MKSFNNDYLQHFIWTLQQHYKISVDKEGKKYCGFTLEWNHYKEFVDISMPGYVSKAPLNFNHKLLNNWQDALHTYYELIFSKIIQHGPKVDASHLPSAKKI